MGISSMPAPKESLLIYLLYHAVASVAALTSLLRAALVFLGLPAPLLAGDDGEGADQLTPSVASVSGPTLAEIFRSRFRPARFGRRNRGHGGASATTDCRVCLVRFEAEAVVNRLPCGHVFHRACLETWLDYDHATCPLCRCRLLPAADEARGSTREEALAALVDAFESFMLDGLVESKYATLLSLFNTSIKKGSTKEACLASRAIGLLSITLGAGSSSHEIMVESHPQLSKVLQTWSDASKMISALECLAVITFVGATDLAETELSLKAMWDVIHPKSGSNVGTVRKPKPPVLAAALSAWTFLLTTIGSWRINADSWKEPIAFLSSLLGAEDRAVRMAAGEALALCFELKLLDVSAYEEDDDDTGVAGSSKSKLFLDMQALKAKISGLASNLSAEAGGKGADKKNLSDQRDLFQRILDFVKYGECPEESLKIAGKRDVLRVSSWSELIQLNFFKHFLGRGFLKHVKDNGLLQDIFSIKTDKAETLSSSDKKIFRSGEEKGRALKLNKDRRQAQERKNAVLFDE